MITDVFYTYKHDIPSTTSFKNVMVMRVLITTSVQKYPLQKTKLSLHKETLIFQKILGQFNMT